MVIVICIDSCLCCLVIVVVLRLLYCVEKTACSGLDVIGVLNVIFYCYLGGEGRGEEKRGEERKKI